MNEYLQHLQNSQLKLQSEYSNGTNVYQSGYQGGLGQYYQSMGGGAITHGGNYQPCFITGLSYTPQEPSLTGTKPVVVCNGSSTECDDLDQAQATAERLAHQHQSDAYILIPKKKIAPKRDVITTNL